MPRTMDEIYAQMERDSQTLNSAINAGAVVMLSTSFGDYQVSYVTPTLEVVCGKGFAQRRMANEVMSNARCVKTGNKPEFEQALRIAEHALRIYQNTYSAPEQLEWATMIYPSGWADLFEGVHEDKRCKTCDGSGTLFIANDDGSTAEVACPEKWWRK